MKRFILIIIAALTLLCLVACGGGGGNNNDDPPVDKPGDKPEQPKDTVTEYIAVVRSEDATFDVAAILNAFYQKNGKTITSLLDSNDPIKGEIVLGDTDRDVTAEASGVYESLVARESGEPEEYGGYVLYKDEKGNVALYWSNKYMEAIALEALTTKYADLETLVAY